MAFATVLDHSCHGEIDVCSKSSAIPVIKGLHSKFKIAGHFSSVVSKEMRQLAR